MNKQEYGGNNAGKPKTDIVNDIKSEPEEEHTLLNVKKPPDRNGNRKTAIKVLLLICGAFVIVTVMSFLANLDWDVSGWFKENESANKAIKFYDADYEKNIFEDEDYLDQNRYIRYTDGSLSTLLITDDDFKQAGDAVNYLCDYFDYIIYGDAESYNSCFTDDYFKDHEKKVKFTMQELYDIEIETKTKYVINEGTENQLTRYEFRVKYCILKNNGTFRNDVGSGAAVPEIYEVLIYDTTGEIKINSISKIKSK